jgi:DNA-binding transcriptional LysR family regulator
MQSPESETHRDSSLFGKPLLSRATVRDALDRIADGTERLLRRQNTGVVTVSTSPNFAAKWLVHRLSRFAEAHPTIDLRVSASLHHIDFAREDIDLAIRHGDGSESGLHVARSQASMAIDAAVDGQGIALARTALAAWDLIGRRLIRPFVQALPVPYAYWIMCPKATAKLPKIVAFSNWLLAEAAEDARHLQELTSASRRGKRSRGRPVLS